MLCHAGLWGRGAVALLTGCTTLPRYLVLLLILFFLPGVVMAVAYGLISRELYRGIRFEMDMKREAGGECGAGLGWAGGSDQTGLCSPALRCQAQVLLGTQRQRR